MSEQTYREIFDDIDVIVREMPGLIPVFEYELEAFRAEEYNDLETIAYLVDSIGRCKKERSGGDPVVEPE